MLNISKRAGLISCATLVARLFAVCRRKNIRHLNKDERNARINQVFDLLQVFGPIMCIMRFDTDEQAVQLANDCTFALGSSVFSGSPRRARWLAKRIRAGMVSVNDFNATYMCQVGGKLLPF